MRGKVIEIATSCDIGLQPPWQRLCLILLTGWNSKTDMHIDDLSYLSAVHNILHLLEIRKVTTVISDKTRHPRLLTDTVDTGTVLIGRCQGFLDVDWFSCLHSHDGIGRMTTGRSCDIDSIDIRVIDQFLGIGIPLRNTMLDGIGAGTLLGTAHHGNDTGALHFREGRTAFDLCHLTTSDKTPFQQFHNIPFVLGNS